MILRDYQNNWTNDGSHPSFVLFLNKMIYVRHLSLRGFSPMGILGSCLSRNFFVPLIHHSKAQVFFNFFFFFFILNAKIYNNILPITLPTKLLYDTTKTLPGGAICHDYPLAFNINLKRRKKNTSKYTTKYKMLNIRRKLFYKQILKPVSH